MTDNSHESKQGDVLKKPYSTPRLETYGDIREVTNSAGMTGNADGNAHGNTKTS
jgi:hypothetical protein